MVRMSRKACCVTPERRLPRRLCSLRNPTSTQFPFYVQKQSKAIKKTTLNWETGPYLVYLHAVDIINQLHCTFSFITSCKKKDENNFTQSTQVLSGLCQDLSGWRQIFTSDPPPTKSLRSWLVHLTLHWIPFPAIKPFDTWLNHWPVSEVVCQLVEPFVL